MEDLKKTLFEAKYKATSFANLALNVFCEPQKNIEELNQKLAQQLQKMDSNSKIDQIIAKGYELQHKILLPILEKQISYGKELKENQKKFEEELAQNYGVDVKYWWLSQENIQFIQNIIHTMKITLLNDISTIGIVKTNHYFLNWSFLQKITRKHSPIQVFNMDMNLLLSDLDSKQLSQCPKSIFDLQQIRSKLQFYCDFYNTVYGSELKQQLDESNDIKIVLQNKKFINYLNKYDQMELDYQNVIDYNSQSAPLNPAYFIYNHIKNKQIILLFRGTDNISDALTDVQCFYLNFVVYQNIHNKQYQLKIISDFQDNKFESGNNNIDIFGVEIDLQQNKELFRGCSHSGIFTSGIYLYMKIQSILNSLYSNNTINFDSYSLIFSGHSLGGATSQVLAFLFILYPPYIGNNLQERIYCYTIGSPPVFSEEVQGIINGRFFNLVNKHDLVPRLQFSSMKDVSRIVYQLHQIEEKDQGINQNIQRFQNYLKNKQVDNKFNLKFEIQNCVELYQYIKDKSTNSNQRLQIVGNVYVLLYTKKFKEICVFKQIKDHKYFEQIVFSKKLIDNHCKKQYKQLLDLEKQYYE